MADYIDLELKKLSKHEEEIVLNLIKYRGRVKKTEVAEALGVTELYAEHLLKRMQQDNKMKIDR